MTMLVRFPLGGRFRMLRWWHQREGHHLILARTHAGVISAWRSRLFGSQGIEFRGYWEIDILGPSPAMHAKAAAAREKNALDDFWDYIAWKARDWKDRYGSLPSGLVRCQKFQPTDPHDDDDEYHYSCANCHRGICVASPETFYRERRADFESTQTKYKYKDKTLCVSRAMPAADGQDLCFARADFGPHSPGVSIKDFYPESDGGNGALFFYVVVSEPSDKEPSQMARSALAENELMEKLRSKKFKAARRREAIRADDDFLALLKGRA